jgi:hypothetical protein
VASGMAKLNIYTMQYTSSITYPISKKFIFDKLINCRKKKETLTNSLNAEYFNNHNLT